MEIRCHLGLVWVISNLAAITTVPTSRKCTFSKSRKEMHCGNENFAEIPYNLIKDTNFESLYMEHNKLTDLRATEFDQLQHKESLEKVIFFNNNIAVIHPNAFGALSNLETLDLSYNKLKDIDNQFQSAKNLKNLNLEGDPMESISEDAFRKLKHLDFLSLKDCQIKQLSPNLLIGSNITELDLSGNFIVNFDQFYLPPSLVKLIPPEKYNPEKDYEKKGEGTGNNVRITFTTVIFTVFLLLVVL